MEDDKNGSSVDSLQHCCNLRIAKLPPQSIEGQVATFISNIDRTCPFAWKKLMRSEFGSNSAASFKAANQYCSRLVFP